MRTHDKFYFPQNAKEKKFELLGIIPFLTIH